MKKQLNKRYTKKSHKRYTEKAIVSWLILSISFVLFILIYLYYKELNHIPSAAKATATKKAVASENIVETEKTINNEILYETNNKSNEQAEKQMDEQTKETTEVQAAVKNHEEIIKLNMEEVNTKQYVNETSGELNSKNYGIVQSIGNVEQKYIDIVEEQLLTLPPVLVNMFINEGWQLCVTTEDIAHVYYNDKYSSVLATTEYKTKRIIIEDRDEAVIGSVQHEFGHFLDYISGKLCWSEEFKKIYIEEAPKFKANIENSSCVRDEQEFFAETFYYLIMDNSKCTPKAKEFIENILNNINSYNLKEIS